MTAESLWSEMWYRVASTRPQLKPEVQVQRQTVRGERSYLLINTVNRRQFRVNGPAYEFIGRCNGARNVQTIWDALIEQFRDQAPTQSEIVETLDALAREELLASDTGVDARKLVKRRDERAQQKNQRFVNPLALRVGLGDPSRLLRPIEFLAPLLFNRVTLVLWVVGAALALVAAAPHWHALATQADLHMTTPRYLLLAWIVFPLLKALHETAHALAVRRWGGTVHEAGFTLFVLVPAPFVDASAAAAFPFRYQRVLVAAAGVLAELAVAAVAFTVWVNTQPGLVRDLAFVTLFIASVSTVLFNGNPLLRFDAYYILCDALDLPNLATRSRAWWSNAFTRALGGPRAAHPMQLAPGERKWLVLYAPLSLAAQLAVSWVLVLWIARYSALLAGLAALAVLVLVLGKPLGAAVRSAWSSARGTSPTRAAAVGAALALAVLVLLGGVPLPFHTVATGVVWPPERARVRAGTDGFIAEVLARDGDWVRQGQVLVVLEDSALAAERDRLVNRIEQLQASRFSAMLQSPEQARHAEEQLARAEAELARVEQRVAELEVRAHTEGRLAIAHSRDLPGSFVRQGTTLAHVIEAADVAVRAAVPEVDAELVRERTRGVAVRFSSGGESFGAELVRNVPAATFELPSPALGDHGAGPHAIHPDDKDGVRVREPVVLVDMTVPGARLERLGGTVAVPFDHGAQPLAARWYRQLRQVFLQHFNPAG